MPPSYIYDHDVRLFIQENFQERTVHVLPQDYPRNRLKYDYTLMGEYEPQHETAGFANNHRTVFRCGGHDDRRCGACKIGEVTHAKNAEVILESMRRTIKLSVSEFTKEFVRLTSRDPAITVTLSTSGPKSRKYCDITVLQEGHTTTVHFRRNQEGLRTSACKTRYEGTVEKGIDIAEMVQLIAAAEARISMANSGFGYEHLKNHQGVKQMFEPSSHAVASNITPEPQGPSSITARQLTSAPRPARLMITEVSHTGTIRAFVGGGEDEMGIADPKTIIDGRYAKQTVVEGCANHHHTVFHQDGQMVGQVFHNENNFITITTNNDEEPLLFFKMTHLDHHCVRFESTDNIAGMPITTVELRVALFVRTRHCTITRHGESEPSYFDRHEQLLPRYMHHRNPRVLTYTGVAPRHELVAQTVELVCAAEAEITMARGGFGWPHLTNHSGVSRTISAAGPAT